MMQLPSFLIATNFSASSYCPHNHSHLFYLGQNLATLASDLEGVCNSSLPFTINILSRSLPSRYLIDPLFILFRHTPLSLESPYVLPFTFRLTPIVRTHFVDDI